MNATETTPNERRPPPDRYPGPNPTRPTRPCTLHNRIGLINRLELLSTEQDRCAAMKQFLAAGPPGKRSRDIQPTIAWEPR